MAIGLAAATLGGAALSTAGSLWSSSQSINAAEELFREQRQAFQNRYRWTAKDLEAAGLNRILALGSPSGGPTGAMPRIENPLEGAASSVKQAALLKAEQKALEERTANLQSDTDLKNEQQTLVTKQGVAADAAAVASLQQAGLASEAATGRQIQNRMDQIRLQWMRDNPGLNSTNYMPAAIGSGLAGVKIITDLIRRNKNVVKQIPKPTKPSGGLKPRRNPWRPNN